MNINEIKEDMKVVGSDDQHVGTVDKVEGDRIKLTKQDSENGQHNFIPVDMVASVEGGSVKLSGTADEAKAQFGSEPTIGEKTLEEAGSAVGGG